MSILLGPVALDETAVAVREQYEEVGGRETRTVLLEGVVSGDVDARLDALLAAASEAEYACTLSLRPGRRLWVRRLGFTREVLRERATGAFTLKLESRDPCEESDQERLDTWPIAASGATRLLCPGGNAPALPALLLVAAGTLVRPQVGDGARAIGYDGAVGPGDVLVFDSVHDRAFLNGEDVTPCTRGEFPRLHPQGTTLTYLDAPDSAHNATATISYRERWW
jgi:hypothetical protein